MSLLKTIDTDPSFAPHRSGPLPERLVSGDPAFMTWPQDIARGEMIHTGVWEATPGETRSIKGETFEFCHILAGTVELTPEGGEPVVYKAGDSFVMKPGFVGVWKTIETVRKNGRHARTAIGVAGLPLNSPVGIQMVCTAV